MKAGLTIGVLSLALLGAALLLRTTPEPKVTGSSVPGVEGSPAVTKAAAPAQKPLAPVFPAGSAAGDAYMVGLAFQDLEGSSRPSAEKAREAAALLAARLAENPALWPEVWKGLAALDQAKYAKAALDAMGGVFRDPAGETWCSGRLGGEASIMERRVASHALALCDTPSSLDALKRAAVSDVEALVRLEALRALHQREMELPQGDERDAIIALIRKRAEADDHPKVREAAVRMTPEGRPIQPAAPKRESIGSRLERKTREQLRQHR